MTKPKPTTARRQAQPKQDKAEKLPRAVLGGRFLTAYDPAKALEIVERLAEGETLNAICTGQPGMPAARTFKRWAVNNPELAKAVVAALQLSAQSLEEEALDTARAIALSPKDGTHVRAAEVKLGQLRWSAEHRDPGKFGSKSQVNIRVPIQIITPMDLGFSSGGAGAQDIYSIQAKTIDAVAQEAPISKETLVPEEPPIGLPTHRTGPRKRVLIPRNPAFSLDRPKEPTHENSQDPDVRESSRSIGEQESAGGTGDPGLYLDRPEEDTPAEEPRGPGQDTKSGG